VKVNGIWQDQCNAVEAAEVVRQVLQLVQHYPEKEVGVITFNVVQQEVIYDLLEASFAQEQLSWPTTLIVKNIENVQGDEKDIIIFSIGYAVDKKGVLHLQFGSLSQAGGENRLNVAITRAREKIMVVTSVHPEQLEVDDVKNEGPRLLRKYLEHARTVSSLQQSLPLFSESASHSRDWYLASRLHSEFVKTSPLPFSDMIVSRLNNYEALVLTDDEYYRTSLSVKAAHAYLPILFEKKKWNFVRLFSRNYWMSAETTLLEVQKLTS
jgi:AAA domain